MRSSLIDGLKMPKQSSISVVDLNNKETTSILLKRMKLEQEKQLEIKRLKRQLLIQGGTDICGDMSSSSCSSISGQMSPPSYSNNSESSSNSSFINFNNFSANSSINSNASSDSVCGGGGGGGRGVNLNSSYPVYKRLCNEGNYRKFELVMSQENLSQQQQQSQQNHQNTNNNNSTQQQVYQPNTATSNPSNTNLINGADRDEPRPQHSVTISSEIHHEQLQKLQSQAAVNLAISVTAESDSTDILSTSHSSDISTSSSTCMQNQTGAKPKDYESGDETEEENEVLEESPEGRWIKRNESVSQRDVPGIDQAFLAMDTEYGIEVVWNEINLSGGKKLRNSQDEIKIDIVFENLINLNHPNIVKFHKYWRDKNKKFPRIIFITEYMSSGSLKQFLRKAKRTNQPIKKSTWKRWCIQLLTALHYLHNTEAPIIHGNLSGETIFIQHNGLIKIGSIAPDIVNAHVKTCIDNSWWTKNRHFMAPELLEIYSTTTDANSTANTKSDTLQINNHSIHNTATSNASVCNHSTPSVDIFSFGMVALEMFNLELGGNGDTHTVTPELIKQSLETLDTKQQDFLNKCLEKDPLKRPSAKELLFHPLLFEVPTLRLLTAHQIIKMQNECGESSSERIFNDSDFRRKPDYIIASTNRNFCNNNNSEIIPGIPSSVSLLSNQNKSLSSSCSNSTSSSLNSLSSSPPSLPEHHTSNTTTTATYFDFNYSMLGPFEANKYLEDVKNGIYPLTALGLDQQEPKDGTLGVAAETIEEEAQSEILPTSFNNNNNNIDQNAYNIIRTSLSPSTTRSLSGTNTSLASTNISSASSSSSTSPSQSLSHNILQQKPPNQNQNQNFDQTYYQKSTYSPPVSNLILNNNLMLNNIQNSTNSLTSLQSQIEQNVDRKFSADLTDTQDMYQYNSQMSSTNSSTAPTPTPFHQQQFLFNGSDQMSKYASPSESPPPQVQPQYVNGGDVYGSRSLSKSPVRNNNNLVGTESNNGNNGILDESVNFERRHAEKMEFYLAFVEKYNNYKLSLNITFDDKTSRFVESQISHTDTANKLTEELIQFGLVSEVDKESLYNTLSKALSKRDLSSNSNSMDIVNEQTNGNLLLNGNLFLSK